MKLIGLTSLQRIQRLDLKDGEITSVSRDNRQVMHDRSGSDQRILDQVIGAAVHERRPGPEDACINGKHVPGLRDEIDPSLDLGSLVRVLFTSDFHTRLQLTQRYGREMKILIRRSIDPSDDRTVRTRLA